MRKLGLVQRRFDSPAQFLRFVDARALALIVAGIAGVLAGVLLIGAAHATTGVKIWFLAISLAGVTSAYFGWQSRSWVSSARRMLGTDPALRLLTTIPATLGRGPAVGLQASLTSEPPGFSAEFRVSWGSFGVNALTDTPATVYGPGTRQSLVLVQCGEGYALGRVARSSQSAAEPAAKTDPFSTFS
jgi:hypothetical protein